MTSSRQPETEPVAGAGAAARNTRDPRTIQVLGRYYLGQHLASGGMGSVHIGLKVGALGFQRLVAIKRLHPHLAGDADFAARFKNEIRLVSPLTHPNVVQTFDVVESDGGLALILEFVEGVTLHQLLSDARAAGVALPVPVAAGVVSQALQGLHAAHEAVDEAGNPLELVHRDVSPQNIMIGKDGLVKVLDFGVAKATSETHVTKAGQLTGKAAYMAPEQVSMRTLDRRTDVFAAGVVLWESLTGERLFRAPGTSESAALMNILELRVRAPSELRAVLPAELDRLVLHALDREPSRRFGTARDFALALEGALSVASNSEISDTIADFCRARLARQAHRLQQFRDSLLRDVTIVGAPEPEFVTHSSLLSEPSGGRTPPPAEANTAEVQGVLVDEGGVPNAPPRRLRAVFWLAAAAVIVGVVLRQAPRRSTLTASSQSPTLASMSARPPTAANIAPVPVVTHAVAESERLAAATLAVPPSSPDRRAQPSRPSQRKAPPLSAHGERRRSGSASAPRTTTVTDPCSPPTHTDAEGIRHFKPECL
jgi:serine/threonine protein kinase